MKIGQVPSVGGTYNTKDSGKVKKTESVQAKKDVAAISSQGQTISKAMQAVNAVPDIRNEKVDELKEKVANGNYNVSGKEILEKLQGNKFEQRA